MVSPIPPDPPNRRPSGEPSRTVPSSNRLRVSAATISGSRVGSGALAGYERVGALEAAGSAPTSSAYSHPASPVATAAATSNTAVR